MLKNDPIHAGCGLQRTLALMLILILALTVLPCTAFASSSAPCEAEPGDVNGDGNISVDDAIIVMRCALGTLELSGESYAAADHNGDGSVTVDDAIRILRIALGLPADPPPPTLTFTESSDLPLPSLNEDLPSGQPFRFGGVVRCSSPILSVTAVVTRIGGSPVSGRVEFSEEQNVRSVELVDPTFPKSGDASLTMKLRFEDLSAGDYTFQLYATAVGVPSTRLEFRQFKVVSGTWRQLISNNLRNNYTYALSFFGNRDEFMFRYKWADGRQIEVESGWLNARLSSVTAPSGQKWYVHRKAKDNYQQAIDHMKNTYVRVHGTYDSGIVRLSDLIATFNGLLNTRFVTARDFVSHHAFATAIDLNASMDAWSNQLSNRELIRSEVQDHLTYNGIKEHNGVRYYDFTYDGSYSKRHKNVPETLLNYLLYELAFYRAGFGWGYYYRHTCDGMHFSTSEMDPSIHNTSDRSLRKVYDYID